MPVRDVICDPKYIGPARDAAKVAVDQLNWFQKQTEQPSNQNQATREAAVLYTRAAAIACRDRMIDFLANVYIDGSVKGTSA